MRQCLFCTNRAESREHVWPKWILERVKPTFLHGDLGDTQIRFQNPELKVKFVCDPCNGGWMSKLESASIPIIGNLMNDIALPLDSIQQFTVASWAIKTAMVWEAVVNKFKRVTYTVEERHALRSSLTFPAYTRVWLFRCIDESAIRSFCHEIVYEVAPEKTVTHGSSVTLLVGKFGIQVFTIHAPKERERPITVPTDGGAWDGFLVEIYPRTLRIANWPPTGTIRDFEKLAQRWAPGKKLPPQPRK